MLKRMIAALLTLMLLAILLPTAALAADLPSPNPDGHTIPSISTGDTLAINAGIVTMNHGTITLNGPTGTVTDNRGTIDTNNGTVTGNNNGIVALNRGIVTANNSGGKVTRNDGTVSANNDEGRVQDNYGTVYNKGLPLGLRIQDYGFVTNNFGTVYNDHGYVEYNGDEDGETPGVVYNDHGQVDYNNRGSTVHSLGGFVFGNTGVVNLYGSGGVAVGGTTHQYWEVTIEGDDANNVTATGLTNAFEKTWVLENSAVTLTPNAGFYFSTAPSAPDCSVTQDGENYKVTNINKNTVITIGEMLPATTVILSGLAANGGDTETTSLLTLTFDQDIGGLTAADLTVTGATKGVLTKAEGETGVYTLAVSDITVADGGSVSVAVQKHGFTFSPAYRDVAVHKYTAPVVTLTSAGSTRFLQGAAPTDAVFRITTDSVRWPLSAAANFANATLNSNPLDLGTPGGAAGPDGSVSDGSVVVTVYQATLNALPPGTHTVVISLQGAAYAGMTVTGVITVAAPGAGGDAGDGTGTDVPKTGDRTPVALFIGSALLAGIFLVIRRMRRKKEPDTNG